VVSGTIGINTKTISEHLRRYLFEKYKEKCSLCGWNKRHSITGTVPLEIDHIDGNAENNSEENLRVICPNCHALTPHFRNLNKGKGRSWRLKNKN
jgi:Zn finger protein HypA/HybF involved in hydrogenase expression